MSALSLVVRVALALAVIVATLGIAGRLVRRRQVSSGAVRSGALQLRARVPLSKSASLVVVHTGGRELVLGVTQASVTLVTERDVPAGDDSLPIASGLRRLAATPLASGAAGAGPPLGLLGAPPSPWTAMLDRARARTLRRPS